VKYGYTWSEKVQSLLTKWQNLMSLKNRDFELERMKEKGKKEAKEERKEK
jgi:hypothetical protein